MGPPGMLVTSSCTDARSQPARRVAVMSLHAATSAFRHAPKHQAQTPEVVHRDRNGSFLHHNRPVTMMS